MRLDGCPDKSGRSPMSMSTSQQPYSIDMLRVLIRVGAIIDTNLCFDQVLFEFVVL